PTANVTLTLNPATGTLSGTASGSTNGAGQVAFPGLSVNKANFYGLNVNVSGSAAISPFQSPQVTVNAWQVATTGLEGGAVSSLALDSHGGEILYAVTPAGLFRSTNQGASWSPGGTLPNQGGALSNGRVAVDPSNANVAYFLSFNGGNNFNGGP